jgi:hypothetical protein
MNKFSEKRKIKVLGNPINKNNSSLHPNSLTLSYNNEEYDIVPSQFYINGKNSMEMVFKHTNQNISRNVSKNMETPDLSIPLTDILNIYEIDTYDELIQEIKKLISDNKPEDTIFRIINIYTRVFFDNLKKNNSSLIKIFKIIFEDNKFNESKTKKFLNVWFENNKSDNFNFNICKDYKNFLSN